MAFTRHFTLVANQVSPIQLDNWYNAALVINRGSSDVFFTVDGTAPAVNGNSSFIAPANSLTPVEVQLPRNINTAVATSPQSINLVSAGTPAVSVIAG